jgi:hypothetical protein
MCAQSATEKDSPRGVTPPVRPRMPWRVGEGEAWPGFRLHVRFVDGLQGTVDINGLVQSAKAGVFAALADPERFARVCGEQGAVTWPGEIALAPDAKYAAITQAG